MCAHFCCAGRIRRIRTCVTDTWRKPVFFCYRFQPGKLCCMKRLIVNVTFLLAGLLAPLVIIEATYRLAIKGIAPKWTDRPSFYFMPESSKTLQDASYPVRPPANSFRITVVGDSFTFSPHMQFDDAFPKRLERMLSLGTSKAEVINAGIPGVSTKHEVLGVRQAFLNGSHLVLLQVTLNDLQEKPFSLQELEWAKRFGPFKLHGFLKKAARYWQSLAYVLQRAHSFSTRRAYKKYYLRLLEKPENRLQFETAVADIAELQRQYSKPVAAVIFPLFGFRVDKEYPFDAIHEYFAGIFDKHRIPVLDLRRAFMNIPIERLHVIPAEDVHPNEIAHRLAAEYIYTWLTEQKLIPSDLEVKRRFRQRTSLRPPVRKKKAAPPGGTFDL